MSFPPILNNELRTCFMSNERDFDLDWQRFPALMAHDLKGPIGNLVLYANLAVDEIDSLQGVASEDVELLRKVVSQIHDTGEKLLFQVQCWVDAHLLVRSVYPKKEELFDIQSLVEQAAEQVQSEYSLRNLKLQVSKAEATKIISDPLLLRNSLKNLLLTVALFGVSGDTIRISTHVLNNEAVFDIDYPASPGMDRVLTRLQTDFKQTRQVDTTEGLIKTGVFGMVFCNLAINALKGSILMRDTGHRAAFSIVLPAGV